MNLLKITAWAGDGASMSIDDGTIELVLPFSPTQFAFGRISLVETSGGEPCSDGSRPSYNGDFAGEEEISTYGVKLDGNGKLRLVQTAKRR